MTTTSQLQGQPIRLDRALECAVVLSWNELMPDTSSGLVRMEYHTGADGLLEYLKVWAFRIRGYGKLVCEYWVRPIWSHRPGIVFGEGYRSGAFSHRLESVIQHETAFAVQPHVDRSFQIYPPTQEERMAAENWTAAAPSSMSAEPLVA
jgi:hypothetical protein